MTSPVADRHLAKRLTLAATILVVLTSALQSVAGAGDTQACGLHYYRHRQPGKPAVIKCDVAVYGGTSGVMRVKLRANGPDSWPKERRNVFADVHELAMR